MIEAFIAGFSAQLPKDAKTPVVRQTPDENGIPPTPGSEPPNSSPLVFGPDGPVEPEGN